MTEAIDLHVFFNFRSPYCYLASKTMFSLVDDFHVNLIWHPLGGWDGRSPPERAKTKVPLVRQDLRRWARRMNIPFNPPPTSTDTTRAGAGSLLAEEKDLLRPYVVEVMQCEWVGGNDIGNKDILIDIGSQVGLNPEELADAIDNPAYRQRLKEHWRTAQSAGVIGVPSFMIADEIFWGNDRIDFVQEHLRELGMQKR